MRKQKYRTMKELYDATIEVFEPKITTILQRGSHIQGPADDTSSALQENMSMRMDNELGSPFPDGEFSTRVKTGTCNVSALPCSSHVHVKPVESIMGMKDGKFFEGACQGKASSQCSFHDAGLLSPSKSSACNERLHTSSETSNFFSVCSSHDPLSENAESKADLRALDVYQDTEMLQTVNTRKPLADNQSVSTQCIFHGHKIFQNLLNKQKDPECHGDDTSCVSGDDCVNEIITDHNDGTVRKNMLHTSASVNILSIEGSEKAASGRFASEQGGCHLQPASNLFNTSDPSVVFSLRDPYAVASSLTGEPSESSMEQVESSIARLEGMSVAKCVKPEFEVNKVDPVTEAVNCPDQIKHHVKSSGSILVTNVQETLLESQHVQNSTRSDIVEDEVKVCDICGDVGREAQLAICSKCGDGAEHIYCMPVKMKILPGGDWMCEECTLEDKTEKQMPKKIEKAVRAQTGSPLVKRSQNTSYFKASDPSNCMKLVKENSNEGKCKKSFFLSKRPMDDLEITSLEKRQAVETSDGKPKASKSCGKAFMLRDSSSKNLGYISPRVQLHLPKSADLQQQLPKDGKLKQRLAADGVATDGKKEAISKMICKSLSFSSPRPVNLTDTDRKVEGLSSKDNVGDLEKSVSSTKGNHPLPSLAKIGSFSSALKAGKRVSSPTAADFLGSSGSKYQDVETVSSHGTAKKESHLTNRGSKYLNEKAGSSMERKSSLRLNEVGTASPSSCFKTSELKPRQVISKDKLHKEHKFSEKRDGFKLKSRVASKDQSLFSSKRADEEQDRVLNDMRQHAEASMQSSFSMEARKLSPASSLVEVPEALPKFPSAVTVPEINYIWKGRFEVQRNQKLPSFCDRIQAHLSTFASPKVYEGATKFSSGVLLEEVPRCSSWPAQFSENRAAEDNIALYFFAEDLKSYGRNYKSLLEGMIENDLALRGDIDGMELLIFASTLLPENSQRWNNLYFLWGVFRAMRKNYFEPTSCKKTISAPRLKEGVSDKSTDLPVSFGKEDVICESKAAFSEHKFLVSEVRLDQQPTQADSFSSMAFASMPKKDHGNLERRQTGIENCSHSIVVEEDRKYEKCINDDVECGVDGSSSSFPSEIVDRIHTFMPGNFTAVGPNSLADCLKFSTLNLELSLGTQETSMQRGVPQPSKMISERNDKETNSYPGDSISLSLSLALPGSGSS